MFTAELLEQALSLIRFSVNQRSAIMDIFQQYIDSPMVRELADEDAKALLDLSAPGELVSSEEVRMQYKLSAAYPAFILLAGIPWLEKQYEAHQIPRRYLLDVLSDIPLWMDHYEAHRGETGCAEYGWLSNHLRFKLFRIGRLEYIYTTSRVPAYFYRHNTSGDIRVFMKADIRFTDRGEFAHEGEACMVTRLVDNGDEVWGYAVDAQGKIAESMSMIRRSEWTLCLQPDDPVLDVHIPEGPPLDREEVAISLREAPIFYNGKLHVSQMRAFTCGSWLMSPALVQISPASRLAAFQQLFQCVPYTARDTQVFERVFPTAFTTWDEMPCETSLQKGLRDLYQSGGNCRQMQGVILIV